MKSNYLQSQGHLQSIPCLNYPKTLSLMGFSSICEVQVQLCVSVDIVRNQCLILAG